MPILTDLSLPADFTDPVEAARAVVTVGITMVTTGIDLDFHPDRKATATRLLRDSVPSRKPIGRHESLDRRRDDDEPGEPEGKDRSR